MLSGLKQRILIKTYRWYNMYVYDRLKTHRGFTRPKIMLRRLLERNMDTIDSAETTGIFEYEWDNCIILDACRYDIYDKVRGADRKRISRGSSTSDFMSKNFTDPPDEDLVYVSAVMHHVSPENFETWTGNKMSDVFVDTYDASEYGRSEEYQVVTPEGVVEAAKEASRNHPEAKMIIHFLQPHYPFLDFEFDSKDVDIRRVQKEIKPEKVDAQKIDQMWHLGYMDKIGNQEIIDGYRHNLEQVITHVDCLLEHLEGKTMITGDHGEFLDEGPFWGHTANSRARKLHEVPIEFV